MNHIYNRSKEELYDQLSSGPKGLSSTQAKQRQQEHGFNELQEGQKKSLFSVFLDQYKDVLVIILIIAAIISVLVDDHGVSSAAVILVVITINAILGTVQHVKAEQSLASLKQLSAPLAKVLRDGEKVTIPSREVTVGDVVFLEAGDFICADGRILENYSLKVNESSLTGESVAVDKEDAVIKDEVPLGDQKNMVFSGSFVTYGRASFLVTDIGMATQIGKVAQLLKNTEEKKTPLQVNLDNFGKKLSVVIMAICALVFAVDVFFRGDNFGNAFMFAVALAVAAIPEALSSIVTIVLSFGTQKMARENAIIRKLQAVEGLGSVSVICSDKTGTLTQNKMTVRKISVDHKVYEENHVDLDDPMQEKLVRMGILCNDSSNADGKEIGDPTEVALINFGDKLGREDTEERAKFPRLAEVPFDSDRKLMSTVHEIDGKLTMVTKGAVDVLLGRCTHIETSQGVRPLAKGDMDRLGEINRLFSQDGLRVLAFAEKILDRPEIDTKSEKDMVFVGLIAMMDPPREESRHAVSESKRAGIRPVMITGDHKVTAAAIARQIGIMGENDLAIDGKEIDRLSDEELEEYVPKVAVYARVSPEHKIRIVRAWQHRGNIVAMTGDGVNDAPALKQADVGVAMGITGSEVAKDAASMVLTDDNFATIVKAIENGRNVYANIKKAIKFLLSGNTAGILAVLYASLASLPLPFAPVHLLFINLLTDSLPAIALGLEPHDSAVMDEKPRPMNESILTRDFMTGILVEGLVIGAMTMIAFHIGLIQGGAALASTMAFATLCLSRLFHGFNSKADRPVAFTKRVLDNRFLWGAFFIGFVLLNLVLLLPGLSGIFEVAPLTMNQLLTIYGLSFLNVPIIQLLKAIRTGLKKRAA